MKMVTQNMNIKENKSFWRTNIRFVSALDLIKCLEHIK